MIRTLITGMTLGVFLSMLIVWGLGTHLKQKMTPVVVERVVEVPAALLPETCWSGTLAVQLPDLPEYWWVNYGERTDNQVQICGVGLRIGEIMVFPDYSARMIDLENERNAWRDCALDGPPLCPEEYKVLKAKR